MAKDLTKAYGEIDEHLKAGRADLAVAQLSLISPAQLPREQRRPFAQLCARAGDLSRGLKILTPLFHEDSTEAPPTQDERALYSVLLFRAGSTTEALRRMRELEPGGFRDFSLYQGFGHVMRWEYAEAIPFFTRALAQSQDSYQQLVILANLAAAHVHLRQSDLAQQTIEKLQIQARSAQALRLLANSHEILAQLHFDEGRYSDCRKELESAHALLANEVSADQLFVLKWKSVLAAFESKTTQPLDEFCAVAEARGHYESLREMDFYRLRLAPSDEIFLKLAFGTPFPSYRDRLSREFQRSLPADHLYSWSDHPAQTSIDLRVGQTSTGTSLSSQNAQLLTILVGDFYRPLKLTTVFTQLFPDSHFDVFTSGKRVHQSFARLRKFFEEERLGLQIEHLPSDSYRLVFNGPIEILIPWSPPANEWERDRNRLLSGAPLSSGFRAEDVESRLGCSRSSALDFIKKGLESGRVRKEGEGRSSVYFLV